MKGKRFFAKFNELTFVGSLAEVCGGLAIAYREKMPEFTKDGMSLVTPDGNLLAHLPKRVVEIPRTKWEGPTPAHAGYNKTGIWVFEDELEGVVLS